MADEFDIYIMKRKLDRAEKELAEIKEENKVLMSECDRLIKEKGELLSKVSGAVKAADVQPVKRGRWSEGYTDSRLYSGICSVCGGAAIRSVKANPLDYCPNCGARMDGDTE